MPLVKKIYLGNIVEVKVDVVVNAANNSLLGGGGVDGAIHRAAGPGLLAECRDLKGCATGDAKVTKGYGLYAGYVIHTVGPVWSGGNKGEVGLLARCYRRSLELAEALGIGSLAFPCISTGVYHFPKQRAAEIAIAQTREFLKNNDSIEDVAFVCFDGDNFAIYDRILTLDK